MRGEEDFGMIAPQGNSRTIERVKFSSLDVAFDDIRR